jgi:hypothetical protein
MAYLMINVTSAEWTRPPPVPVIVIVLLPFCTFRAVEMVSTDVPEPVMDEGLKAAVARDGRPLTVRLTGLQNPGPDVIVTVYVVAWPREIVRLVGVTESVKSPFTMSVTFTLRVNGPLVPRIVNVYVPDAVAVLVVTLSDVEPDPVRDAGVNAAVAPDGSPVTLKLTVPEKPDEPVSIAV